MENIISINKLTFRYDDSFLFDKFSLDIKKGEWVTIVGSNGSGKTTLLKILSGLILTKSDIAICNLKLNKENLYEIRKNIGVVFDNPDNSLISETVEDDVVFILENLGYSKKDIKNSLNEATKLLKIKDLLSKSPDDLSGGEKVLVSLAASIIHKPQILMLDESLSMINAKEKNNIFKILDDLHKKGMTIINIAHDLSESYYSDRLIVLNNGEIMLDGNPLKVMEHDKILNRLGIELPFEVELSIKLKLYGLIDNIIPNIENLVDELWQ